MSLKRRLPLRRRGRPRFPKRRDPAYMAWLAQRIDAGHVCDACGCARATQRAHLVPKGIGGNDRLNVVLLCHHCHLRQEKRTDDFIRDTGVDLYAIANAHDNQYMTETGQGRE